MKTYYLYIEAGAQIDKDSKFYKVGVGTSKQATRDYLYLIAYSVQHGHYFEKWSSEVATFLNQVAGSMNQKSVTLMGADARDLVRQFKAFQAVPLSAHSLRAAHQLRMVTDTDYRISSNLAKRG